MILQLFDHQQIYVCTKRNRFGRYSFLVPSLSIHLTTDKLSFYDESYRKTLYNFFTSKKIHYFRYISGKSTFIRGNRLSIRSHLCAVSKNFGHAELSKKELKIPGFENSSHFLSFRDFSDFKL